VLLGSGIGALEVLTAFPYFAAIALILGSSVSGPNKVFLLVVYCAVYTAPLFGIAAVCAGMKDRAQAVLGPIFGWLLTHWPIFVASIAVVIGIGLTAYGIVRL
jgi:Sap, sulfolipid-1-addressing protein